MVSCIEISLAMYFRRQQAARCLATARSASLSAAPDARLEKAKTLNDYHPFTPPEDAAAWSRRAERVREQILVTAGLWPMPPKAPLEPVVHGNDDVFAALRFIQKNQRYSERLKFRCQPFEGIHLPVHGPDDAIDLAGEQFIETTLDMVGFNAVQ